MTTLRQAVHEYIRMRRHLGFKLHEPGKGLLAFVRFMERHRARVITQTLALTWAQQPRHRNIVTSVATARLRRLETSRIYRWTPIQTR